MANTKRIEDVLKVMNLEPVKDASRWSIYWGMRLRNAVQKGQVPSDLDQIIKYLGDDDGNLGDC